MARRIRCPHCARTFAAPTTQQAKGGRARAATMSDEARRASARLAARARWDRIKAHG